MNTKALRQKILDLAIHGKLLPLEKVEQIRKDEPASILLEKIRAEKQEKIAKGELKKDKNDSFIFVGDDKRHYEKFASGTVKDIEDEIPFDVPNGWCWVRLGRYIDVRDGTHDSPKYVEKGYPFITSKNLVNGKIDFTNVLYISEKDHSNFIQRSFVEDGDILFAMIGSIGNPVLVKKDREFSIKNVALFKPYSKEINYMQYILFFLMNIQEGLKNKAKGGMQPFIPLNLLRTEILLPLPPLTEQKLIVEEIEKIFAQIDLLEQNKTDLQTAIKQVKSKILDLAIHGKLVPQDPNDEPASVLLEKIRAEKEEKIAKGKLKRDKNDSYIYKSTTDNCHYEKLNGKDVCIEDEIPFTIPDSWQWCRLKKVCSNFIVPQRDKPKVFNGTIPWCRIEDIEGKYLNGSLSNQLVTEETIKEMNMHICPAGSVICSCSASIGVQAITTVACCTNQTFIGIVPIIFMLFTEYLFYFLKAQTKYFHEIATGTTIKYISREKFEELFIPLPPLSEQKRIVAKIEELFSLLDQIQTNIV